MQSQGATRDLDVFIRSDSENAKAVFRALAAFGAPLEGMSPADFSDGTTFQIGHPPDRIDILQQIDGVSFDEEWRNRIEGAIDDQVPTSVISREDLIRTSLLAAGSRPSSMSRCSAKQSKPQERQVVDSVLAYSFFSFSARSGT